MQVNPHPLFFGEKNFVSGARTMFAQRLLLTKVGSVYMSKIRLRTLAVKKEQSHMELARFTIESNNAI